MRYADDFIILGDNLKMLKEIKYFIKNQLSTLDLQLNKYKTQFINLNKQHFDFLGYNLLKNNKILLKSKTKQSIKRKLNRIIFKIDEFRKIMVEIYSYTKHSQDYFGLLFRNLYS